MKRTIGIVGSGPAGFYTAEAALKAFGEDVSVDIIDRLPTPYGLIRSGVAPDHQSIKAVSKRYDQVASDKRVRFLGNVTIGDDLSIDDLRNCYDHVILATGAPHDRMLGIEGEDLPGVYGSTEFVGWYNGHPDHAPLTPDLDVKTAVVIGNGNVAIDCARILAKTVDELSPSDITSQSLRELDKSAIENIHIVGRRGPLQASFTLKEIGEMGELSRAAVQIDPACFPAEEADEELETGQRRVVKILRGFAADGPESGKPLLISFDFFQRPLRILGKDKAEAIEMMRTRIDENGKVVDTGETVRIAAGLIIKAIGYRTIAIPGVPYDEDAGRFTNDEGLIAPGLWCVGWARRGPSGTIGTNRPDGIALIKTIEEQEQPSGKPGPAAIDKLAKERNLHITCFEDWRQIDAAEVSRARKGAPREKFVVLDEMKAVIAS